MSSVSSPATKASGHERPAQTAGGAGTPPDGSLREAVITGAAPRAEVEPANTLMAERGVLAAVAFGTMLAPLNSTMIAVAMPHIMIDFDAGAPATAWLVIGYLVTMAALQPVAGKIGDRFGRRALVLGGLASFGLASLAAAMVTSLPLLILFRVLQAVAGAVALPNAAALVRQILPAHRRASGFGFIGAAAAVAAAAGPPLGGLVVGVAGWRAMFYVNVPLVLVALAFGFRSIPRDHARAGRSQVDRAGAVLLPALLGGTAYLLSQGLRSGIGYTVVGGGALLIAGTVLFAFRTWRHPDPVLQPRFFGRRPFAAANAGVALSNLAMYVTLLAVPLLLSTKASWTSVQIGLILTALSVATVVCAPAGGRLADRFGRRAPVVAGHALLTFALLPLALAGGNVSPEVLLVALGLAGVGLGIGQAGMQTAALESVGPQDTGAASGIYSTSRYLGSIVGSAALAGLLGTAQEPAAFTGVFMMVVIAAFLSAVVTLGLPSKPHAKRG